MRINVVFQYASSYTDLINYSLDSFAGLITYSLNFFTGLINYSLDSFSGLKYSLDNRINDGFLNDNLVSFFVGVLKYSLDKQFDIRFLEFFQPPVS